jgi:hypothetical protein
VIPLVGYLARYKLFKTHEELYDVLINYIEAHNIACQNLQLIAHEDEMLSKIKEESEALCKQAGEYLH